MAGLFGIGTKKKSSQTKEEVVLLVDIENGSIAAALVMCIPGQIPKLFAEERIVLPIPATLNASLMARDIHAAIAAALSEVSLTAARLRNTLGPNKIVGEKLKRTGTIDRAVIFLSPPWVSLESQGGELTWSHESTVAAQAMQLIEERFGRLPTSVFATGEVTLRVLDTLFDQPDLFLLCLISAEISELMLVSEGVLQSRATIPTGSRTLLRTLTTHTGMTQHEAQSALGLTLHATDPIHPFQEPLTATARHFGAQFAEAARTITDHAVPDVLVVAPEPQNRFFARSLAHAPFGDGLREGSTVRALHAQHLFPHISSRLTPPDLMLMTEGVFINS